MITAMEGVRDKFGTSTQSILLVFRTNPEDPDAISDIRDRRVLKAMDIIVKQIEEDEFVLSSLSILDFVKEDERIPDQREINSRLEAADTENMLNDELSFTTVRFTIASGLSSEDMENLANYVTNIVDMTDRPPGVEILPAEI